MVRIIYMGKVIRDDRGRFSRARRFVRRFGVVVIALALMILAAHPLISKALDNEIHADGVALVPVAHADITMEAKVEALKDQVVDDLATKCETKDVAEPDAAIVLDTNDAMSIGAWMFQVKTVQHYVKIFEGRDIGRVDAVRIAIDHDQARALAKRIIFEEQGGIYNWSNCAAQLDLVPTVEIIKTLEQ